MNKHQVLGTELSTIYRKKKTGRLFAYCEGNERGFRTRPAEADFADGEIVSLRFAGQQGMSALSSLNEHAVDRVMFMETATITTERDADLLNIEGVLALLTMSDHTAVMR